MHSVYIWEPIGFDSDVFLPRRWGKEEGCNKKAKKRRKREKDDDDNVKNTGGNQVGR